MLRLISCQHATLLLEQRADIPLPGLTRRSLAFHVFYCPHCRHYAKQTVLVAQLARVAAQPSSAEPGLSEAAKIRLRAMLT